MNRAWLSLFRTALRVSLLAGLLAASAVHADTLYGRVVRVSDGDTITVLDENNRQHKARLTGIDAPEKCQPFYNLSRQYLADLVFQKNVAISYHKFDRNGRVLGKVLVDGRDINLE